MNVVELFQKGGPSMYPLLFLSFLALTAILERLWFWFGALTKERETVNRVLDAARRDWSAAAEVARQAYDQPIGRFLYTPLQLKHPDPDTFRLALEAAADEELSSMRRGDKILEAVIALAPMLGLLGTVIGLIVSLQSIRIGDIGTASTTGVTSGIGEALISTASGLVVAVIALVFYRLFQGLLFNQIKIFRRAGNELELMYRQRWAFEQEQKQSDRGLLTTSPASPAIESDFSAKASEKAPDAPKLTRRNDDRDEKPVL